MNTMKAVTLPDFGGVENLQHVELPVPEPQAGEVLIRVKALSINPVDFKTRRGQSLASKLKEEPGPIILGWDVSGEVAALGAGAQRFAVGDAVFGMVNFPGHGKAYAEYVVAPETHLARKPASSSHAEAAAATLAALTAWQALVTTARLQPGERVLVHAAAGGVGHYAVQIAKHLGAYVIGTASAANRDFVRSLGADEYLDYTAQNFEDALHDIDVVLDTVGGDTAARSLRVLKSGGRLVSILNGTTPAVIEEAAARGIQASSILVYSDGDDMAQLAALMEAGALKSHVSLELPLSEMAQAHKQLETGRTRGKVVLIP